MTLESVEMDELHDAPFGQSLRRLRLEAGLTQEALADLTGLSVRGISDLERGQRRYPRLETVRLVAEALGLSDVVRAELMLLSRPAAVRLAERPRDGEPASSAASGFPRQALLVPVTQLIGREQVVDEVVAMLRRDGTRLLTLTGPGGAGKSRLSVQVASELRDAYPDGTALVLLASLAAGSSVLPAIAETLGIRETGDAPLDTTVAEVLGDARMLLVLDNFEHLIDEALVVNDLLERCPGLVILVTSRAALRLRGEQVYPVGPLDVPGPGAAVAADDIRRYGALELFTERARLASATFEVHDRDVPIISEICRRLDGLPLAVELAAARTRVLSVTELLHQLDDRLSLLSGGSVDLPVRHQTLRSTIRWSYDLLSEDVQRLFRTLTIFSGGWTLPAAEALALDGDETAQRVGLIDGLTSLIENNLVQRRSVASGGSRFDMLDTIRAFGLEMLAENGEIDVAHRRHFNYFQTLVTRDITSGQQAFHPIQVEVDIDNVRAALRWAIDEHDAASALTLAAALREFWTVKGLTSEGRRWLDAALALDGDAPVPIRTAALDAACSHACHQGDLDRAAEYAAASLALSRADGDPASLVESLHYAGLAAQLQGDFQSARVHYEECVTLRRRIGNVAVTRTLGNLAQVIFHLGDSDSAIQLFDDCIALDTTNHNIVGQGLLMTDLALILVVTGDDNRARDLFRAALPIHQQLGHVRMITTTIQGLATLDARSGLAERAIRLFGAADAFREAIVHPLQSPDEWRYRESVELARSQVDPTTFARIWNEGRTLSIEAAIDYALDTHHTQPVRAAD